MGQISTPALDQESLNSACRALYDRAGEDFTLPPRAEADDAGAQPGHASAIHIYDCPAGDCDISFLVALDEARVGRDAAIPLEFKAELRCAQDQTRVVEVDGRIRFELIRAFLLGVKAPMFARRLEGALGYRLSIQLSSTFFVDCGDLDVAGVDAPGQVCDLVAEQVYSRTKDLFMGPAQGHAVWRQRAAQDLFGEAKPAADVFWPAGRPTLAVTPQPVADPRALPNIAARAEAHPTARPMRRRMARSLSRPAIAAALVTAVLGAAGLAAYVGQPASTVEKRQAHAAAPVSQVRAHPGDYVVASLPDEVLRAPITRLRNPDSAARETTRAIIAVDPAPAAVAAPAREPVPMMLTAPALTIEAPRAKPEVVAAVVKPAKAKKPLSPLGVAKQAIASFTGVVNQIGRFPNRMVAMLKSQSRQQVARE